MFLCAALHNENGSYKSLEWNAGMEYWNDHLSMYQTEIVIFIICYHIHMLLWCSSCQAQFSTLVKTFQKIYHICSNDAKIATEYL